MNFRAFAATVTIGFVGVSIGDSGQTINWSSAVGSEIFDSEGSMFPSEWTVALGTFGGLGDTFAPMEVNTDDWLANWVPLDTTSYVQAPFPAFQSSVIVSDVDRADEQLYMWFYNNQVGDVTSEWALISEASWVVGSAGELADSQGVGPISIVMQDATSAEWGRTDSIAGGGVRSSAPVSFDLQTHTFENPIP